MTPHAVKRALGLSGVAMLLAGCGGTPQTLATISQGSPAVRRAYLPTGGDLMYVSATGGQSYVLSYPDGKLVGTINQTAAGACADASGNVYLPGPTGVLVYSHGSTSPRETLSLANAGTGCSVDPMTGNLAVTTTEGNNGVAIFEGASGQPKIYQTNAAPYYCGYDNQGDLFVDGYTLPDGLWLAELPKGSQAFSDVAIKQSITLPAGQVQWEGNYLTLEVGMGAKHPLDALVIDRLEVSGYVANVVSQTTFKDIAHGTRASWIYGNRILVPLGLHQAVPDIGLWAYPRGGKAKKIIKKAAGVSAYFTGITISVGNTLLTHSYK